jgi:tRNA A37 N6-isopentenylltransferase MiaA
MAGARLPILVGGTGLYIIKALLEDYAFSTGWEKIRDLRRELEAAGLDRKGEAALVQKLAALDPRKQAAQVDPHVTGGG